MLRESKYSKDMYAKDVNDWVKKNGKRVYIDEKSETVHKRNRQKICRNIS